MAHTFTGAAGPDGDAALKEGTVLNVRIRRARSPRRPSSYRLSGAARGGGVSTRVAAPRRAIFQPPPPHTPHPRFTAQFHNFSGSLVYKAGVLSPAPAASSAALVPAGSPFAADALTAGWAEELAAAPPAGGGASSSPAGAAGAPAAKRPRRGRGEGEGASSSSSSSSSSSAAASGGGAPAAGAGAAGAGGEGGGGAPTGAVDIGALLCEAPGGRALVSPCAWVALPAGALGASPSARWGHGACVVDEGRRVVLYGGEEGSGRVRGDTWCLDTAGGEGGGDAWSLRVGDGDGAGGAGGSARAWHAMVAVPERAMIVAVGKVGGEGGEGGGACGGAGGAAAAAAGGGDLDTDVFDTSIDLWYPPVGAGRPPSRRVGTGAALVRAGLLPSASSGGAQRLPEPMVVLFGGLATRGANRSVRPPPFPPFRRQVVLKSAPPPPPLPPSRRRGSTTCTCGRCAARPAG
jgi:hypothetical protein